MKPLTSLLAAAALVALTSPTLAQADHQQHHPGGVPATQAQAPAPAQPPSQMPTMGKIMQSMPDQCRVMMQNMPQSCISMMQQMMQGGMKGGGMQGQDMATSPSQAGTMSEATKAYIAAMDKMNSPMMEGVMDADPDVAFVKSMIPHHQGAIAMAKVALQYGKDEQTKKWASDVILEQEREIGEMQSWLRKMGKM